MYQILPKVTQSVQLVPKVTKNYRMLQLVPKVTKCYQLVPKVILSYSKLPKVTQSVQLVPKVTKSYLTYLQMIRMAIPNMRALINRKIPMGTKNQRVLASGSWKKQCSSLNLGL